MYVLCTGKYANKKVISRLADDFLHAIVISVESLFPCDCFLCVFSNVLRGQAVFL